MKSVLGRPTGFLRSDSGSSAVEFALISPVLMMLLFGILETSRAFWIQGALSYSVDQAARCAAVDNTNCGTTTQVKTFAATHSGFAFDPAVFTVSNPACGRLVTASFPFQLSVPYIATSLTLTARACYPD